MASGSPARRAALPFAGSAGPASVVSHLAGAHSIGGGVLGFLTLRESNAVRGVCHELREAVRAFPWADVTARIRCRLAVWRAAFPAARALGADAQGCVRGPQGRTPGEAQGRAQAE